MEKLMKLVWKAEMWLEGMFIAIPLIGFSGLFAVLKFEKLSAIVGKLATKIGLHVVAIRYYKLADTDEDREKAKEHYLALVDDYNAFDIFL